MDLSIFQNARFQPAPDQTDQAWITDSKRDEAEDPIMIETPEEVLQIRLQYPSDFAAGDSLVEGRQGMMSAECERRSKNPSVKQPSWSVAPE